MVSQFFDVFFIYLFSAYPLYLFSDSVAAVGPPQGEDPDPEAAVGAQGGGPEAAVGVQGEGSEAVTATALGGGPDPEVAVGVQGGGSEAVTATALGGGPEPEAAVGVHGGGPEPEAAVGAHGGGPEPEAAVGANGGDPEAVTATALGGGPEPETAVGPEIEEFTALAGALVDQGFSSPILSPEQLTQKLAAFEKKFAEQQSLLKGNPIVTDIVTDILT